ncbi:MAG: hypothetical protein IIW64_11490 [Selenomonadaceae bacterium]|nr:hypothetical protein [Selenomonadaceae bacterium]
MAMNAGNRCKHINKGKKANRKLAMLVGMALGFSVAYGVVPSEVAWADTVVITQSGGSGFLVNNSETVYSGEAFW